MSRTRRSGRPSSSTRLSEVDRAGAQVIDDRVDQPGRCRRLGPELLAGRHHLERQLRSDEAWQALRTAGTGQEAELDLGQAELRRADGDAVMADERDLEAAAERGAVDRGDDRLRAVLDRRLDVGQRDAARRLAELTDVGPGDEGTAGADQDDRPNRGIGDRRGDGRREAVADLGRQRVDRRRVQRHDADVAVDRRSR